MSDERENANPSLQDAMEQAGKDLDGREKAPEKVSRGTDAPADDTPKEWEGPGYTKRWKAEARKALETFATNPDNAEHWKALQGQLDETHKYLGQREQMLGQYQKRYEPLNDILSYAERYFGMNGMGVPEGLRQLLTVSEMLGTNPDQMLPWLGERYKPRDAGQVVQALAQRWGVDLGQIAQGQPYIDPAVSQMVNPLLSKIQQLEQAMYHGQQQNVQAAQQWALQQIQAFESAADESGNPKHPYLHDPDVFGLMVYAMNNQIVPRDLSQAYEWAVQRHLPAIQERAKAAERKALEDANRKTANSNHAKQASNNLNGSAARSRKTGEERMTMREAMQKAAKDLNMTA